MTSPTEKLDWILRSQRANFAKILVANGYQIDVQVVDELDQAIRDDDGGSNTAMQGPLIIIADLAEDFEYRTAGNVRSFLQYEVFAVLAVDPSPSDAMATMRTKIRAVEGDLWKRFHADIRLYDAAQELGFVAIGSGCGLVTQHQIRRIERGYAFPRASIRMEVFCAYDFNVTSS